MSESIVPKDNQLTGHVTPMAVLYEWCLYRGLTPKYDFVSSEGQDHCPKFVYSVTAGELSATGSSTSKRTAKQAAAQGVLDIIAQKVASQNGEQRFNPAEPMDQDKEENTVGKLQELCLVNSWPVPEFNKPQVVVTCKVGNQHVTGYGTEKKQAKKEAAAAMIKLLEGLPKQESWRTGV